MADRAGAASRIRRVRSDSLLEPPRLAGSGCASLAALGPRVSLSLVRGWMRIALPTPAVRTPLDCATSNPKMTSTLVQLTDGRLHRRTSKPVELNVPHRTLARGERQDDLDAAPSRTTEAGGFLQAPVPDEEQPARRQIRWCRMGIAHPSNQVSASGDADGREDPQENLVPAHHPTRSMNGCTSPRPQYSSDLHTGQFGLSAEPGVLSASRWNFRTRCADAPPRRYPVSR